MGGGRGGHRLKHGPDIRRRGVAGAGELEAKALHGATQLWWALPGQAGLCTAWSSSFTRNQDFGIKFPDF